MVTDDPYEAEAAVARGEAVVFIVGTDAAVGTSGPESRPVPTRPGRLALFAGDPADPAVWRAAAEMEAELYPPTADRSAGSGRRPPG